LPQAQPGPRRFARAATCVAVAHEGASGSFRTCPSPACRILLQLENLEYVEKAGQPVTSLVCQSDSVGVVRRVGLSVCLFQTALLLRAENPLDFQ